MREDDYLLLPVVDPEPLQDMDLMLADFEEREVPETDYRNLVELPPQLRELLPTSFDQVGDIAIIRLPDQLLPYSIEIGRALIRGLPRLRTVCLDRGVQGKLRVRDLEVVSGDPSTETTHTEFGLRFRVDVSKVYFNPRLANERRRVSSLVREGERVIDMFAGVGPFSIMIARFASPLLIHAIDLNPVAVELMRENIALNKVSGIIPIRGDAREVLPHLPPADRIIMNLPHSSHQFLADAGLRLRTGGSIHLYTIWERVEADRSMGELLSEIRSRGIDLDLGRMVEMKTYSASMSVYSADLVLTHRSCQAAQV